MRSFIATMVYELHPDTPADARKLLRAHLVGRRWQDRHEGAAMPSTAVWIRRSAEDHETSDDLHAACARDLDAAAAAVARAGRPIQVMRAWIQVSGAGTYGLAPVARPAQPAD
ncbi:hypothetical protein [Sorangium sp. So ce362]|uniref:hypothetical protein n=1 Tax=Sorangium sp. So ce362 TaxID=3133303 RepID=UPI003F5E495E